MVAQIKPQQMGVQAIRGVDPGIHLREGQQIQAAASAISGVANKAMDAFQALEQDQNTADMSIGYSQKMQEVEAHANQNLTASQVMELGVEDSPNLWTEDDDGNLMERADIRLDEVYPEIAKKNWDNLTTKLGGNISGHYNRQEWINKRRVQGQEAYRKMTMERDSAMYQRTVEKWDTSIQSAKDIGDFGLARSLIDNHPGELTPEQVTEANYQNNRAQEVHQIHKLVQGGTLLEVEEAIANIESDQYTGFHTEPEQTQFKRLLEAKKSSMTSAAKVLPDVDALNIKFRLQEEMGDLEGQLDTYSKMVSAMGTHGQPHYKGKDWPAQELARITGEYRDETERMELVNNFWGGNFKSVEMLSAEQKGHLNDAVDAQFQAAIRSGSQEQIVATAAQITKLSANSNWIPDALTSVMNAANSPAAGEHQLQMAASVYGQLVASGNHALLAGVDGNTISVAQQLVAAQQAGNPLMDARASSLASYKNKSPEAIKSLEDKFKAEYMSTKKMNRKKMENLNGQNGLFAWFGATPPKIDAQMSSLFDQTTMQEYVNNGGDYEAAASAAWVKLTNQYQPTKINGLTEWVPSAIEHEMGVERTKAVRESMNSYLELHAPNFKEPIGDARVTLGTATSQTMSDVPHYPLWKETQWGAVPVMNADDTQAYWVPSRDEIQGIDERMKQEEAMAPPPTLYSGSQEAIEREIAADRLSEEERKANKAAEEARSYETLVREGSERATEGRRRQSLVKGLNNE